MINEFGSSFTITGSVEQRITVTPDQLPRGGIRTILLAMTGAGNGPQYMNEIVLKIENDPVIQITGTQLRAILEALSPINYAPAADALYVWIPLDLPRAVGAWGIPATVGGIPSGVNLTLEVLWSSSCVAGTMKVGWIRGPDKPAYMSRFIKAAVGIGASQSPGVLAVNRGNADVYGFLLPNGTNDLSYVGPLISSTEGIVHNRLSVGMIMAAGRSQYSELSITDPLTLLFPRPVKLPAGSKYEIWTGSGADGSEEYVPLEAIPLR